MADRDDLDTDRRGEWNLGLWTRGWRLAFAAVVAGAFVIRLIGASGVLPFIYEVDEVTNFRRIDRMVDTGSANPHFFNYPSLFFDIQALVHWSYLKVGTALGMFENVDDFGGIQRLTYDVSATDYPSALLAARLVVVALSTATVAAAAWLARLIGGDRRMVLATAGLVATAPLLVAYSWSVTPDTLAGLTTTLALGGALLVYRRGRWSDYVVAGIFLGLAAGSKYNVAVAAVGLLAAHLLAPDRRPIRRLVVAGLISLGSFLAVTPFAVFEISTFVDDVTFEVAHYSRGHTSAEGGALFANLDWIGATFGPLLVGLVGLRWAPDRRAAAILAGFVGLYFVLVSLPMARFERNLVPLVPSLAVLVAVGAVALWDRFRPTRGVLLAGLAAALTIMVAWPLVGLDQRLHDRTTDGRAESRKWIVEHVTPGSTVALESGSPFVDRQYNVVPRRFLRSELEDVLARSPDIVILTETGERVLEVSPELAAEEDRVNTRAERVLDLDGGRTRIYVLNESAVR